MKLQQIDLKNSRGIEDEISANALAVAKEIRGVANPPAIMIHGVMPRSGTVYAGELLRLHPDVCAYPNEIWEIPFLKYKDDIASFSGHFFKIYLQNMGKIGADDFQCLFGASFIAYLYSFVPKGNHLLLKTPWADNLDTFFTVFHNENLISLLRDGRDVVHSTTKTWKNRRFSSVCKEWDKSARMMLDCDKMCNSIGPSQNYLMYKYEDILKNPTFFIETCCKTFGLDPKRFPYSEIEKLPVRGSSSQISKDSKVSWEPQKKTKAFTSTRHWEIWPERKKAIFKKIAGRTLIRCGYCNDLNW